LRVLVVSQYFWPENFRINDLVSELTARGHSVTVLTGVPNYPEGRTFPEFVKDPGRFSQYAGAPVIRVPMLPRRQGKMHLALNYLSFAWSGLVVGSWRLRGRRFDAIFVFQISPITAALPAVLQRRLKKAPLLLWVLDLWPETLAAVGVIKSPRVLTWVGYLVAYIYRRCDRILIQSRAFGANIERYAGDRARIRYFPGWAESTFRDNLENVAPAPELAAYRHTFNILLAGNIGDAQDFPAILDAAENTRERDDIRWIIVGDGRAAEYVRSEIKRRALQEKVVMLGRYPLERMPSFFRAAGALLVTLRSNPIFSLTIPGKVQSYLGAGVPILGMLDGEGARVIEQAEAGLVCPAGQGRALARCAEQMADMSLQDRTAMGTRGREYCRREFDRATLVDDLEKWIAELGQERLDT
jgi:glycosyltransferase involved in cell wall biosynthesis